MGRYTSLDTQTHTADHVFSSLSHIIVVQSMNIFSEFPIYFRGLHQDDVTEGRLLHFFTYLINQFIDLTMQSPQKG